MRTKAEGLPRLAWPGKHALDHGLSNFDGEARFITDAPNTSIGGC